MPNAPKTPEVADVPGAADLKVVETDIACGVSRQATWYDGSGIVLRQDVVIFVRDGFLTDGAAQL